MNKINAGREFVFLLAVVLVLGDGTSCHNDNVSARCSHRTIVPHVIGSTKCQTFSYDPS